MSMKLMRKLSIDPMGNLDNPMPTIGCFEVCQAKDQSIILFQSSLSRARSVLESFIKGFSGTIICDGYSAYDKIEGVTFANCWAHVRRYWLKAESKNGQIGVKYCDDLYRLRKAIQTSVSE